MGDKKDKGEEIVPTRENFDFAAYIAGKSTFPKAKHTVYLNQEAGMQLVRVADEYTALAERAKELQRTQNRLAETVSGRSLVDEDVEEVLEELSGIERRIADLEKQIADLEAEVKKDSLTIVFQAGTAQKLGKVVRQAEKEFHKENRRGDDNDIEYITAKSRYVMAAQLAEYCVQILDASGREIPVPGRDGFLALLDSLISSESIRLVDALNKSLDSSITWANRLDAGFPGGGNDVGGVPMGGTGAEDSQVMGDSAADAPHREEDRMV